MSDTMTSKEAAGYLRTSDAVLQQWRYLGKGPKYYKLGRKVIYKRTDLDAWMESQAVTPRALA